MFSVIEMKLITTPSDGVVREINYYPINVIIEQNNKILHNQVFKFDDEIKIRFDFYDYSNIKIKIIPDADEIDLIDFPIYVDKLIFDEAYEVKRLLYSGIHHSSDGTIIKNNTNVLYTNGRLEYNISLPIIAEVMQHEF